MFASEWQIRDAPDHDGHPHPDGDGDRRRVIRRVTAESGAEWGRR